MMRDLDSYNFSYPDELVALNPLAAKDQANMLVFKKKVVSLITIQLKFLSRVDLILVNNCILFLAAKAA